MCADVFRYYDGGPRKGEVLLCLPGASGTAEIFYKQMLILCPKGYRVVTVQFPPYYTHDDWLAGESTLVPSCPPLRCVCVRFLSMLYVSMRSRRPDQRISDRATRSGPVT